ncbi:MAG: GTPase [Candidatus Hodarchaeales archaeon]|jgi:small GTP-binding protein
MVNYRNKFKWYRFNVARKIRILEGDDLIKEVEVIINDIREKKLDKNGMFKILIRNLENVKAETLFKPKSKSRQFDPFHIPRSGDGRISLFGLSNVGKSTLMNAITNTDVKTGDYLHTTQTALAGTCEHNKLKIQIIDVPGFLDFKENWVISKQIVRVARTCDAIVLVIDLSQNINRQYKFLMRQLNEANLLDVAGTIYRLGILATKGDLPGSKKNFTLLKSLSSLPILPITIKDHDSLMQLKDYLFQILEVMRIYTKPPRQKINNEQPFICPIGTTVEELSSKIHKDFVKHFRYAKVWGTSVDFPGKRVGLEHQLMDEDILEITLKR